MARSHVVVLYGLALFGRLDDANGERVSHFVGVGGYSGTIFADYPDGKRAQRAFVAVDPVPD